MSWEKYVKSNILEFRKRRLTDLEKELTVRSKTVFHTTLYEPCQIVVIDIAEPHPKYFLVLHSEEFPDMEIAVVGEVALKQLSSEMLKKTKLLKALGLEKIQTITEHLKDTAKIARGFGWLSSYAEIAGVPVYEIVKEPRTSPNPFELSRLVYDSMVWEIGEMLTRKQKEEIEETVGDIRRDAEAIPTKELRTKIIESTGRLEGLIEQLQKKHEKLKDDLVGVRRLVGTKSFGEWKVLLSEIDKMNTRINALSDIKSGYDKVLAQQADLLKQQSSFMNWIKYSIILLPIAVASISIIEILIRHFLGVL